MTQLLTFKLNGKETTMFVKQDALLIDVIRDELGLTGTKKSCRIGECGACTVLLDGYPVRSCILPALAVAGKEIITIEGLRGEDNIHPIQQAFIDAGAIQCGFCTPGMILTVKALLDTNANPTDEEIKDALSGNFCRCTGYEKIIRAVKSLVQVKK